MTWIVKINTLIILTNGLNTRLIKFFGDRFNELSIRGNEVFLLKTLKKED